MPARHLSSVLLPEPLRPMIPKNSPSSTSNETSLSACSSVACRERLLTEAGFEVVSHDVPFTPPEPAAVAVLSERDLGDLETVCADARGTLAHGLVVVLARPAPEALLECLTAGVRGFTTELEGPADLVEAVRAAAGGHYHVAPGMLALLLDWHRVQLGLPDERARARDRDLIGLLAAG